MTVGEKFKYYRNIRGISQEMLGNLSGINPATIKKYEYGIRNPKPDQLLKITNALGISINLFMDFDIETVSDVLSLLFKLNRFRPYLSYPVFYWSVIHKIKNKANLRFCIHWAYTRPFFLNQRLKCCGYGNPSS